MNDLCYLSAAEALTRFRNRSLSPVELLNALIARSQTVEPKIGAFTQTYFEEALAEAEKAEKRYARGDARALEGLPIAIKEDKGVRGKLTTIGSRVFAENIASRDAIPVQRIREAGGIIHARTNVCEMGTAPITGSRLHPPTRNPWNVKFNSGGSSGGAAAALACGTTTLANGSDYCGSIRIPAASCGVIGYKPPRGRNAVSPYFNIDWYDHDGPMARTVADCALLQNVMSGHSPQDLFSLREKVLIPEALPSIKGWNVALSIDLGYVSVESEVAQNTRSAAWSLHEWGVRTTEVDLDWTSDTLLAYRKHSATIFGAWVASYLPAHAGSMTEYAVDFGKSLEAVAPADFLSSMEVEAAMWDSLAQVFEHHDVLVCPTLAVAGVSIDHNPARDDIMVNGKKVSGDFGWLLTYPFNMLSPLPVINVPTGFSACGLPTGLQIVGRPYDDIAVFAVAAALEKSLDQMSKTRPRLT